MFEKHVFEFEDDIIEDRQVRIAEQNKIKLTNHSLYLYGECQRGESCEYKLAAEAD